MKENEDSMIKRFQDELTRQANELIQLKNKVSLLEGNYDPKLPKMQ